MSRAAAPRSEAPSAARCAAWAALLAATLAPVVAAPAAGGAHRVVPGTVVRWPGEGIDLCGRGHEHWQPINGGCWFAIDLLRPPGPYEVYRYRGGQRETLTLEVGDYPYPVQHLTLEDDSRVHLSVENEERARHEQRDVSSLWPSRRPRRFELPLHPPLAELSPGGSFGSRRFFNGSPRSPHSGADYEASTGDSVYAAATGRVRLARELFFSGRSVFLDHGDGLVTMYFHLSEILVEEGEEVNRGELVGRVGATGRVTGPHLHFGVRWRGARVDPALLLGAAERVPVVSAP